MSNPPPPLGPNAPTLTAQAPATFTHKNFEKTFFSPRTNRVFCSTFLQHALCDPVANQCGQNLIGKSLVFCVNQNHAACVTQILNQLAHSKWPGLYNSDFAMQVTSSIEAAGEKAQNFSNNKLSGYTRVLEGYKSSKTRVCVTVGMMTTGYDCQDVLNICLMRPIFSPTNFVQMKGRGTRMFTFKYTGADGKTYEHNKTTFKIFDFFANCEFFEEKFNYDQDLKLPPIKGATDEMLEDETLAPVVESVKINTPDRVQHLSEQKVGLEGMRVDREFWSTTHKELSKDNTLVRAVNDERWDVVDQHMRRVYDNRPRLYLTLEKVQQQEGLDRRLSWPEVVQRIFNHIDRFFTRDELLNHEFNNFLQHYKSDLEEEHHFLMRNFFRAYAGDVEFRKIIESKDFTDLHHSNQFSFDDFKQLCKHKFDKKITSYIKNYVNLNRFL